MAEVLGRNQEDLQESLIQDGDEETEIYTVDIRLNKQLKSQLKNIAQNQQRDPKLKTIIDKLHDNVDGKLRNTVYTVILIV